MRDRDTDNTVLDTLMMVILFIMAGYMTCSHNDTFYILAERVEIEVSGKNDLWVTVTEANHTSLI